MHEGDFMASDILATIKSRVPSMSKGQRHIAEYILANYDKAAFMTASRLGSAVGVSESTVVRFSYVVGYDGYPSLQKALQEMIRNRLTSVQRIEVANSMLEKEDLMTMVLQSDIDNIRGTIEGMDRVVFQGAVDAIVKARHIYILGVRSSAAIANFLGFYFNMMFDNVKLVDRSSISEVFEQTFRVGVGDVVIGISFPRYSSRTVKAVKFASDRGASVVALTDSLTAPIAEHASYTLVAKSDMISVVDSLVAPLSLVNALIVAVSQKKDMNIPETFMELEHIWDEYGVYEKIDG